MTTWIDLEGIMLTKIYMKYEKVKQTYKKRDQTSGYQKSRVVGEGMEEGGQRYKYKIHKY